MSSKVETVVHFAGGNDKPSYSCAEPEEAAIWKTAVELCVYRFF